MQLVLSQRSLYGLGEAPPVIFGKAKLSNGQIKYFVAEPHHSLLLKNGLVQFNSNNNAYQKEQDWTCSDWILFHKGLVNYSLNGYYFSVKLANDKAIAQANQIVTQHWTRNKQWLESISCPLGAEFIAYFTSVGMASVVSNVAHRLANKTIDTGEKIVKSGQDSLVNAVDAAGNLTEGIKNITGGAKYIVPVLIGGVVLFVGAYAYKNFIKGNSRISVPTPGGVVTV